VAVDRWLPNWLTDRLSAAWLRTCDQVGPGAHLRGKPLVMNQGRAVIGARFALSSLPVISHLIVGSGGSLEIGDGVIIGHGCAISCNRAVRIGDGTSVGPYLVLADSDFHVVGARHEAPEPRPIEIGRNVKIGARVNVLPGSRIGDGATVLAGSTVSGVVAPHTVVSGVPARVGGADAAAPQSGSLAQRVCAAVARALGLPSVPDLEAGPAQIPEWDSLGALRLVLALEDDFRVRIGEQEMVRVRRVADLVAAVEARTEKRSA
jgi:acetyltransferase-like isoleucine patch superfamily enzyme/acyl carrier protein